MSRHHRADQSRAACRSALGRLPERTFNAIFTARLSAVEAYLFVPPDFLRALTRVLRLFRGWWNIAAPGGIINIECTFNAPLKQRTQNLCRRAWRAAAAASWRDPRASFHAVGVCGIHRSPASGC